MRAKEFICEASYDSMITSMKAKYPKQIRFINDNVRWAKQVLRREDRVVYFLRILQLFVIYNETGVVPDNNILDRGFLANLWVEVTAVGIIQRICNIWGHYVSLNIPAINDYRMKKNDDFDEVLTLFYEYETDYYDKQTMDSPIEPQPGDKEILKFEDGSAWWFVDRSHCSEEGRSGQHCGNSADGPYNPNDRILSYRKDGTVYMTFIIDPSGLLGEMKGRNNHKPGNGLFKYIIPLLLSERVTGIKGGGYKPKNNFSVFDLSEDQIMDIWNKKPNLLVSAIINLNPDNIINVVPKFLHEFKPLWAAVLKRRATMGPVHESASKTELRKGARLAASNLSVYAALDNNNSPYSAYRFGLAMAMAPDCDMAKRGPVGGQMMTIDYTDADAEIRKSAEKAMGVKATSQTGKESKENTDVVNIVSPVAKPKRNKYGI